MSNQSLRFGLIGKVLVSLSFKITSKKYKKIWFKWPETEKLNDLKFAHLPGAWIIYFN